MSSGRQNNFLTKSPYASSHRVAVNVLKFLRYVPFAHSFIRLFFSIKTPSLERELFGLRFKNPVGIAAGLDRKGEFYNDLGNFGPSFVEIGPIKNVKKTIQNLTSYPPKDIILAVNLNGRLSSDPVLNLKEIEHSFSMIYDFADAIVVTVPGIGYEAILDNILTLRRYNDVSKPIIVKITNIVKPEEIHGVVEYSLRNGVDCIECIVAYLPAVHEQTQGLIPLIALAYLENISEARSLLENGASLVSLATGLLKNGPSFIKRILKELLK